MRTHVGCCLNGTIEASRLQFPPAKSYQRRQLLVAPFRRETIIYFHTVKQQNQTKSEKMRWRCYSRRRGVILHTWSNVEAFFFYFFFRSRLSGTCISHANTHTESRHALTTAAMMLTMERSSWICFEFSMQMQHNIWHSEMRSVGARDHRLALSHNTADWCWWLLCTLFLIDSLQPIILVFSIRNLCCLDPTEIKRVCVFGISLRVFFCWLSYLIKVLLIVFFCVASLFDI